jgi:NAD-dependent SIR2 family protein deacetylase
VTDIKNEISKFISKSKTPICFMGAGVSSNAGLPTWKTLLEKLQKILSPYDSMYSEVMGAELAGNEFLRAAEIYFFSNRITPNTRYKGICENLSSYDEKKIKDLFSIPFSGFVTTNYDRASLDAYALARSASAHQINRIDGELRKRGFK